MRRGGFTFMELLAVLIVLGLLSGMAVVRLTPMLRTASLQHTLRQLGEADRLTRRRAQQGQISCRLVFDLDKQLVYRLEGDRDDPVAIVHLRSARIEKVRTLSGIATSGTAKLVISPLGFATTYALQVSSEAEDRSSWLLFYGLSRHREVLHDEAQVDALFEALARGADAD